MKKPILFLGIVPLLVSCSNYGPYNLSDYQTTLEYKDGFSVLVLNDLHLAYTTELQNEFDYYLKVIFSKAALLYPSLDVVELYKDEAYKDELYQFAPDIIFLNGDTFMNANKKVVKETFKFFDSLKIPFGFAQGNHDFQGFYSNRFIDQVMKDSTYCVNKNPVNDDVTGDTNYVVNLVKNNEVKWQLFGLDCNSYENFAYDCIHQDQVDWYKKQVIDSKNRRSSNDYAPSLIITHIPLQEFEDAWEKESNGTFSIIPDESYTGKSSWWMLEGVSASPKEDQLFETIQELEGATKGIIVAHDHINLTDFYYSGEGNHDVRLIYGMKTGQGIYHDERMMGGTFYELDESGTFEIIRLNVPYGFDETNNSNGVYLMDNDFINKGGIK